MAIDPRQTLPTKINLITLRRSLSIIGRVRKILEDKREVLLLNIRITLDRYVELRKKVLEELRRLYEQYFLVLAELGLNNIYALAESMPKTFEIIVGERAAFGVKLPVIELIERSIPESYSSFFFSTVQLDLFINRFRELLPDLIKLSELEAVINRLILELKNTQKLINSLDYYIIPLYQEIIKRIRLVLEERSREEFIRLKIMKSKLVRRGERQ
ncbi:MAG: V-type ATP synthase subunit D [Sulfolobales archaeon]